jgi:hypothetical protein
MNLEALQKLLASLPEDGYIEITQRVVTIEVVPQPQAVPVIEVPEKVIDVEAEPVYKGYLTRSTDGENDNG